MVIITEKKSANLILLCSTQGIIKKVIQDDFQVILNRNLAGRPISSVLDQASIAKAFNFIEAIKADGSAYGWELNVATESSTRTLVFRGSQTAEGILIIGSDSSDTSIRNKGGPTAPENVQDFELYNKLTALTSELVAMQRELVKKNSLLQEVNEEKNALLGMAAHELRSPLGVILAYTELLQEDTLDDKQKDIINTVQSSVEFMLGLINNLLDITKIEAGKLDLQLQTVDLGELLQRNVITNQSLAQGKRITIINGAGTLPFVVADPSKIEQVLYNLISNSIKFSKPGGRIYVNAIAEEQRVLISVTDEGQGIPSEEIEKLFRPFARASTQSTGGEVSTGLGLAISKKIVEEHGGQIWLESQVNIGTTCYFTIPLGDTGISKESRSTGQDIPDDPIPKETITQVVNTETPTYNHPFGELTMKGTKVLLVDDDPIILDYIFMGLSQRGYKVSTAGTGKDALKMAHDVQPDLVILDWVLPDAQGPELCQRIKSISNPVIVMLSSKGELTDKVTGLQSGADDYQTKPFHFQELLARIESHLRRQGSSPAKRVLHFSDISLWPERREARRGQNRLNLTPTEFDLLHLFMQHPHQVLPKDNILERVWGYSYVGDVNIVEVYMGYLRRKLGKPALIKTVRGVGYILDDKNT